MSHKKLVLKKSAGETVAVSLGMEYSRTFHKKDEPFSVETKYADAILRTHDEFAEFKEPKAKKDATPKTAKGKSSKVKTTKAKTSAKKTVRETGVVQPAAEPNTDPNTHSDEISAAAVEKAKETAEKQPPIGAENK